MKYTRFPILPLREAILDKVSELIRAGKVREIADMRDETDLSGLKLTIDLKRGADPEKLMQKLFRQTTLMDSYPCNFNILIAGMPRVMGVGEILEEWTAWRCQCVKRRVFFQLGKKREKLHLLKGLERILLDIDKAIAIIRGTELEAEVIPNLMIGFGIDQVQAEFVAEIKLRNINKEYILKRTAETGDLEREIQELEATPEQRPPDSEPHHQGTGAGLQKFGQPRKTELLYHWDAASGEEPEEELPDYPCHCLCFPGRVFQEITPQSLRASGEQKFKEGDGLAFAWETTNRAELLVFTDQFQCYKARLSDFDDGKASQLGDYLPTKLSMDPGENVVQTVFPGDYSGFVLFFFESGKVAKVPLSSYDTKSNRRKLTGAYSDKSPLRTVLAMEADGPVVAYSTDGRAMIFSSAQLTPKTTRPPREWRC